MNEGEPSLAGPHSPSGLAPGLYLTATPIGHARDVTLRAIDVLKGCDLIAAEDTRITSRLLAIHAISRPLRTYNDHNAAGERPRLLSRLKQGARIALVSDAGTPLISDPGYKLVRACVVEGISVHVVPGACAAIAALSASGLPTNRFLFAGFAPSRAGERRAFFADLMAIPATLVFYESPQRLAESLADMAEILGCRDAVVARELTKLHETNYRGPLPELAGAFSEPPKGEITIVVAPPGPAEPDYAKADKLLDAALAFMPVRPAADLVSEALALPRREAYARALARKQAREARDER